MTGANPPTAMGEVQSGLELLLERLPDDLCGARVGLLSNQSAVDRHFVTARERLAAVGALRLVALFAPQHGFCTEQQDNMIESEHALDPVLRIPVHSLYSETRKPTARMLDGIDALLVDLQDIGCRVYTFVWTLTYCLEACRERGIRVVVLDRPNPLGGITVEGQELEPGQESFVGRARMPMRHGLTMGELALFLDRDLSIGAQPDLVRMRGWKRSMYYPDTGLPWVAPSPNLPRFEAALVYPGQVLLEGTSLSEGRGTTLPFEQCGAPFIEPYRLRDSVGEFGLVGVVFRPVRFEPTFHKFQGRSCGGVCLHVTDPARFAPYRTTLSLLASIQKLWPGQLAWKAPPYEYELDRMPIDCITGGPFVRRFLDQVPDLAPNDITTGIDELCSVDAAQWKHRTQAAHRYPEQADSNAPPQ